MGHPPWHMWGNTQPAEVTSPGGGPLIVAQTVNPQLVRIAYGRPETWTFMFHAYVQDMLDTSGVLTGIVGIRYNLTIGVGRSHCTINAFEEFSWANLPTIGDQRYSTSVNGPLRDGVTVAQNVISEIPAQDIQLNATVYMLGAVLGSRVVLGVSAFFAPKSHIRPEWFIGNFRGKEDDGA